MSLAADLAFGTMNEEQKQGALERCFMEKLTKDANKWALFDFYNEARTVYVEMKSRNNKHDTYPTTIVGRNKIAFCTDPNKKYYFVFVFQDGIYYIQYDKAVFDAFECADFVRNTRCDYQDRVSPYVFIPVSALTRMNA
jgi:hypothetical protein